MRRARFLALAVVPALFAGLAGCDSAGDGPDDPASQSHNASDETENSMKISALEAPAGAHALTEHGITLSAPADWTVTRSTSDGAHMIKLQPPGGGEATAVIVAVNPVQGTDTSTYAAAIEFVAGMRTSDAVSDLDNGPATWGTWPYAQYVTAAVLLADGTKTNTITVVAHDDDESMIVTANARDASDLTSSTAYEILRTIRPAPATD